MDDDRESYVYPEPVLEPVEPIRNEFTKLEKILMITGIAASSIAIASPLIKSAYDYLKTLF